MADPFPANWSCFIGLGFYWEHGSHGRRLVCTAGLGEDEHRFIGASAAPDQLDLLADGGALADDVAKRWLGGDAARATVDDGPTFLIKVPHRLTPRAARLGGQFLLIAAARDAPTLMRGGEGYSRQKSGVYTYGTFGMIIMLDGFAIERVRADARIEVRHSNRGNEPQFLNFWEMGAWLSRLLLGSRSVKARKNSSSTIKRPPLPNPLLQRRRGSLLADVRLR